jgi:polyphenol oxidase
MFYSKNLKKFKNLHHCFFSRNEGFSTGIYASLNCGKSSKDNKKNVLNNLNFISNSIGLESKNLILMNQTHSNNVITINESNKFDNLVSSDAIITQLKNTALGVLTADCVPVILYDSKNEIIGCIHAGWKGSQTGIIENTIDEFKKINSNNEIIASVGPCIGKNSYEVGKDFYEFFLNISSNNKRFFFVIKNKHYFDIRSYVNHKLHINGVKTIDNVDFDTFLNTDNFFSYRRSKKLNEPDYGRCISTICLKN